MKSEKWELEKREVGTEKREVGNGLLKNGKAWCIVLWKQWCKIEGDTLYHK